MSESSSRCSEDEQHDQESVATTRLLIAHNTVKYHSIVERANKLQDMLALQQVRLRNQQLHLLALEQYLKRQARKVCQSEQHLER